MQAEAPTQPGCTAERLTAGTCGDGTVGGGGTLPEAYDAVRASQRANIDNVCVRMFCTEPKQLPPRVVLPVSSLVPTARARVLLQKQRTAGTTPPKVGFLRMCASPCALVCEEYEIS